MADIVCAAGAALKLNADPWPAGAVAAPAEKLNALLASLLLVPKANGFASGGAETAENAGTPPNDGVGDAVAAAAPNAKGFIPSVCVGVPNGDAGFALNENADELTWAG